MCVLYFTLDKPIPDFVLEGLSELRCTMKRILEEEEDDTVEKLDQGTEKCQTSNYRDDMNINKMGRE